LTQEERQERSRQRILSAAMEEFGAAAYETVTMDRICANHEISKGLMYHYYTNKDELFLLCVKETFRLLREYLEQHANKPDGEDPWSIIRHYFMLRERFIIQRPECRLIYETAVLHPPPHLAEETDRLYEPISNFNQSYLREVVARLPLRPGIQPEKAMRMLKSIGYLMRIAGRQGIELPKVESIKKYLDEILDMALFGVLRQAPEQTYRKDTES